MDSSFSSGKSVPTRYDPPLTRMPTKTNSNMYPMLPVLSHSASVPNLETLNPPSNPNFMNNEDASPLSVRKALLELKGRCEDCIDNYFRCRNCKMAKKEKMKTKKDKNNTDIESGGSRRISRSPSLIKIEHINDMIQRDLQGLCRVYQRYLLLILGSLLLMALAYALSVAGPYVYGHSFFDALNRTSNSHQTVVNPHTIFGTWPFNLAKGSEADNQDKNMKIYSDCAYFLPDCDGLIIDCIVGSRNIEFSLHGAWNLHRGGSKLRIVMGDVINDTCLSYDDFSQFF